MVPLTAFQVALSTTHQPFLRNFARSLPRFHCSAASDRTITTQAHVSVFDNVLSPACRAELTTDALYNIGPDIYRRSQGSYSPQEVLIESILSGLGSGFDSTREVEWWGKSTHKSVEAHRDVDEEAASARGGRRFPTHSVIVYLDAEEGVRAPTCLWIPGDGEDDNDGSALLAVPVVPGRLLLFSGELLHAVPRPALRWLDPVTDVSDGGTCGPACMRRVLVMNLWDDYAPKDEDFGGEECDDWDDEDWEDDEEEEELQPIEFFAKRVECEPRSQWLPVALQGPPPATNKIAPSSNNLPTLTLSTRSHGSDEPLLSPLKATSHTTIARILESKSIPEWLWTGLDVGDLGIGVPSLAGSRAERIEFLE